MPESEMYFCSSISGLLGTGITVSMCFGAASFAFFLLETAPRPTEGADDGLEDCEVPVPELPLVRCFKLGVPGFIRWPASCYERAHCATVYFCPRSCTLAARFGQHTRLRPPPVPASILVVESSSMLLRAKCCSWQSTAFTQWYKMQGPFALL